MNLREMKFTGGGIKKNIYELVTIEQGLIIHEWRKLVRNITV